MLPLLSVQGDGNISGLVKGQLNVILVAVQLEPRPHQPSLTYQIEHIQEAHLVELVMGANECDAS